MAIMTRRKPASETISIDGPLGIEELELALNRLGRGDVDTDAYWDEHIESFRQTVLHAIRETADAILTASMSRQLRVELEDQLAMLGRCIELADQYRRLRALSRERPTPAFPPTSRSIH